MLSILQKASSVSVNSPQYCSLFNSNLRCISVFQINNCFFFETMNNCNWTRTQNHLVLKRTLNHLSVDSLWNAYVTWQEHTVRTMNNFEKYVFCKTDLTLGYFFWVFLRFFKNEDFSLCWCHSHLLLIIILCTFFFSSFFYIRENHCYVWNSLQFPSTSFHFLLILGLSLFFWINFRKFWSVASYFKLIILSS